MLLFFKKPSIYYLRKFIKTIEILQKLQIQYYSQKIMTSRSNSSSNSPPNSPFFSPNYFLKIKNKTELADFVNSKQFVFLQFQTSWYGPCKAMRKHIQKKALQLGVSVGYIDIQQSEQLASEFDISSVPTFIVIQKEWNNEKIRKVGGSSEIITKMLIRVQKMKNGQ